jgi:hypothetical protein
VHGGKFSHLNFIVKEVEEAMAQLWKVNEKMEDVCMIQPPLKHMKWLNPPLGRLKANWDMALNTDVYVLG